MSLLNANLLLSFLLILCSYTTSDKKYYLQVYLDNCAYKTVNKQMADYLDENIFDLRIRYYKCGTMI